MSQARFSLAVGEFIQKAEANADIVLRRVAADVFREVVLRSPVDTGRFRANWQMMAGGTIVNRAPVAALDKTGAATIAAAVATVERVKVGERVVILNGLPYGVRLEYGWSQQAPAGMVRLTLQRFQSFIQAATASLPK